MVSALSGVLLSVLAGLDTAAGVRSEAAVGIAPATSGQASEPMLATEVIPFVAARLADRAIQFRLRYYPRIYYREPNIAETHRPLLLQQLGFTMAWRLQPRLEWASTLVGAIGETDYTSIASLARDSSSALQRVSSLTVLRGEVTSGLRYQLTRRHIVGLRGLTSRMEGLGTYSRGIIPVTTLLGAEFNHQWRWTRIDTLSSTLAGTHSEFLRKGALALSSPGVSPRTEWVLATASLEWRRALGPLSESRIRGGVSVAKESGNFPLGVTPNFGASLVGPLDRNRQHRVMGRIQASADSTFDALRGTLVPLARLEAGFQVRLDAQWTAGLLTQVSTAATAHPLQPVAPESTASFSLPFLGRISRWAVVEFGMRGALRASHWANPDWKTQDYQLWSYASFTLLTTSGAGDPGWAL